MITDYNPIENGVSLLLPQFSDKEKIVGMLSAFLTPTTEIISGANEVSEGYDIETAVGQQLDFLGKLVNTYRLERTDDDYRDAIKARIVVNNATGAASNFIKMLKLMLGNDVTFKVIEQYPASVQVVIYSPQTVITAELINDILPLGVRGIFFGNPYEDKFIFEFSEVDDFGVETGGTILPEEDELDTTDIAMAELIYT